MTKLLPERFCLLHATSACGWVHVLTQTHSPKSKTTEYYGFLEAPTATGQTPISGTATPIQMKSKLPMLPLPQNINLLRKEAALNLPSFPYWNSTDFWLLTPFSQPSVEGNRKRRMQLRYFEHLYYVLGTILELLNVLSC